MHYFYKISSSPVGMLKLVASERGLAGILWEKDKAARVPHLQAAVEAPEYVAFHIIEQQLREYFDGNRRAFDLALDFTGAEFNRKVWNALLTIPYGETRTYGQLAAHISHPNSARAVGMANSKNPISIIAPCHRVIGASGKLTGFAGGLETKAYLLNLERGNRSLC